MPHQSFADKKPNIHVWPLHICPLCVSRLQQHRTWTWIWSGLYVLAAVFAVAFRSEVVPRHSLVGALIAGGFAFAPPLYFAFEYWWHEKRMIVTADMGMFDVEDKTLLDQTKTYQESVSKVWIAIAAGIAYLYIGGFANNVPAVIHLDPSQSIICNASGASSYTCAAK